MPESITVFVHANDPTAHAEAVRSLAFQPGIAVVEDPAAAGLAVIVADKVDEPTAEVIAAIGRRMRRAAGTGPTPGAAGLDQRHLEVLRLLAAGSDTADIARALCYSERTIKYLVRGITTRLGARNRAHAVACAMRIGLI
jgi:DNA-binding CsgD family transcriptional regulator